MIARLENGTKQTLQRKKAKETTIVQGLHSRSPCKGSVAKCLAKEEFELDSEISRHMLVTTRYISYGALQRNTVPFSQRGASYYNCQARAQANPYNYGCSRITRCRS
ncbi:Rapid alkalinization factor 23 [Hibiscus syriacus]|uniref:Rapid alkalinization factor 23 n=1 Tax=Hibiscus syriacus TaxID=106335 RepID=A0A6A2XYT5_HIBSY|nr:Rapid alkalinization factor 23 [Hibiscus syriacus]